MDLSLPAEVVPPKECETVTRAILIDALGTLVELEPPWLHLARELGTEPDERLVRAVRAEMAYYREHSHEGRDRASLDELRTRCAEVLSRELDHEITVETMMSTIRFRAFPDAAPALAGLRARGLGGDPILLRRVADVQGLVRLAAGELQGRLEDRRVRLASPRPG